MPSSSREPISRLGEPRVGRKQVKAALLTAVPGRLQVEEVAIDSPIEHEVLVQTLASGLCHSDLHVMLGDLERPTPAVLGHEAAGAESSREWGRYSTPRKLSLARPWPSWAAAASA
jgi:hypothetical protein